jgi:pyruvate formate lyase activating enzyme
MTGRIFDFREMTVHDGPGIRCTVFFKGCPLRCAWCHNPEGISFAPVVMESSAGCAHCGGCRLPCDHLDCAGLGRCVHRCPRGLLSRYGEDIEPEALAARILSSADIAGEKGGGVTISGGEPLAQADFLFALLPLLRLHHLAIETSGLASPEVFRRMVASTDLVIMDIKHADSEEHKRGTGQGNELILRNLGILMETAEFFWIRIPLIPGYNDDAGNLEATAALLESAAGRVRVELLACNRLAGAKYKMLGQEYAPFFDEDKAIGADLSPFVRRGIEAKLLG